MVRKPHEYDAELQALMDRAKKLQSEAAMQLGELVEVTDASTLLLGASDVGRKP